MLETKLENEILHLNELFTHIDIKVEKLKRTPHIPVLGFVISFCLGSLDLADAQESLLSYGKISYFKIIFPKVFIGSSSFICLRL